MDVNSMSNLFEDCAKVNLRGKNVCTMFSESNDVQMDDSVIYYQDRNNTKDTSNKI